MATKYKVVSIDELFPEPSLLQSEAMRAREVAKLLATALNDMAASGWELVTNYRGTTNTLFVFKNEG